MSLLYILRRVAQDSGTDISKANKRAWLVDKVNEAAKELYESTDLPVSLQECYVAIDNEKRVALPPFIGELRAVRSACDGSWHNQKWSLKDMRPKYVQTEWTNRWANFRLVGYSPIAVDFSNAAPGNIVYPEVDEDLEVTIVGDTSESNRGVDTVSMTTATKGWTKSFTQIKAIRKNKVTDYNVLIQDADGTELAIIYADQLESRYLIVDISEYPGACCCVCPDGTFIVQVLYKPQLARMENDNDTFPVDGFDDAIVLATKGLLAEGQEGKEERALLIDQKLRRKVKRLQEHKEGTTQKMFTTGRNKLLGLFHGRYHCD